MKKQFCIRELILETPDISELKNLNHFVILNAGETKTLPLCNCLIF